MGVYEYCVNMAKALGWKNVELSNVKVNGTLVEEGSNSTAGIYYKTDNLKGQFVISAKVVCKLNETSSMLYVLQDKNAEFVDFLDLLDERFLELTKEKWNSRKWWKDGDIENEDDLAEKYKGLVEKVKVCKESKKKVPVMKVLLGNNFKFKDCDNTEISGEKLKELSTSSEEFVATIVMNFKQMNLPLNKNKRFGCQVCGVNLKFDKVSKANEEDSDYDEVEEKEWEAADE